MEGRVGAVRGAEGGVEQSEEVATLAGDVVQGDGELAVVTGMLEGDAFGALGDGALRVRQFAAVVAGGGWRWWCCCWAS